nr:pilus assembly protein PilM [uncultured Pseudomonas sp.]
MLGRLGKDAGSLLGVEIAADSVRMLQLQRRQGVEQVSGWAYQPLPGAIGDDWAQAPAGLIEALRCAFERSGSRRAQVAVALPGGSALCKLCCLPTGLSAAQLEQRLLVDAEHMFPFALEDLALDFQVLGPAVEPFGHVNVLVAACRQRSLDQLEHLLQAAGLCAAAVEVDSIALRRLVPGGQALLRIEQGGATLHDWSASGLPQRQELTFGAHEPDDARLQRMLELCKAVLPGEHGVQVIAASEQASRWLPALVTQLPCAALSPLHGLGTCGLSNRAELAAVAPHMALACALALGGAC